MNRAIYLIIILNQIFSQDNNSIVPDTFLAEKIPPFKGTIFIDSDILTSDDPTSFIDIVYVGKEQRKMYDRRVEGWIDCTAFLFNAIFEDSLSAEIQINPEFKDYKHALFQAKKYSIIIGRLPHQLRKDVKTVWIHRGLKPFGGGNNNLLIHTDWSEENYEDQGILEETFIHEASHTSLDNDHASNPEWIKAQSLDNHFISNYAKNNPKREDIAESYLTYFAIKYKSDRISKDLKEIIINTIPNRIKYFDNQKFNLYPLK